MPQPDSDPTASPGDLPPLTRDDLDLLGGLAYDAAGQAGGLSRGDQERFGLLVIRAEVELRRLRRTLAGAVVSLWDEVDRDDVLSMLDREGYDIGWAHDTLGEAHDD